MIKAIGDKVEVSVDFPGKPYMGSFTRHSGYTVTADKEGVHIHLEHRVGEHRRVGLHIHHHLMADLIEEIGTALKETTPLDRTQRQRLEASAEALLAAVKALEKPTDTRGER